MFGGLFWSCSHLVWLVVHKNGWYSLMNDNLGVGSGQLVRLCDWRLHSSGDDDALCFDSSYIRWNLGFQVEASFHGFKVGEKWRSWSVPVYIQLARPCLLLPGNYYLPKPTTEKNKISSRKLMQRQKNGCKHYQRGFQYLLYIDFNINLVFQMTSNEQGRNRLYII